MARGKIFRWPSFQTVRTAFLIFLLVLAAFALYLDFRVRNEFEGRRFALPARVYARPLELYVGLPISADDIETELRALDYRPEFEDGQEGRFRRIGDVIDISARPFVFWDGAQPARQLRIVIRDNKIDSLQDSVSEKSTSKETPIARLEPQLIGGIYPAHNEDRLLVKREDVPPHLVQALLAVEDRKFYSHIGIDPRGLARALVSTLSGGGVQGGSTLTQQLVKNFFLTSERTLTRKVTEIMMALLLELHYDKDEILETYLNEIYLGQDRNRAIHGVGLAAQFYFGKPVQQLSLTDAALLVGMIKGPALYEPHRHAQRALERRNLVLSLMRDQQFIDSTKYLQARVAPLSVTPTPVMGTSPHPGFIDLVRRQLKSDYAEDDLRSEGLRIFTTLDPPAQRAAEQALGHRLAQLDPKAGEFHLEGAVVVTNSQSGEVQALVAGRDVRYQGYNRAFDATRPVGSLMKPAVYLAALSQPSRYTLVTPLNDEHFVWKSRGAPNWEPANYDKKFHGQVPLRTALANSYNAATARLGTDVGVDNVINTIHLLGVQRELPPYASTMLGAVDLTPFEVTQMYQTIASGGFRTPLRAIREVVTSDGKPLQHYELSVEQAFSPESMYLLTTALQGVVQEGTATGLKNWLAPELNVAGKTGTTDDLRDAWFAGFTGDRLAVVWIGYDDNRPTHFTGAGAALPLWGEMMARLSPEPLTPPQPENIERVHIDIENGLLADSGCANTVELPFIAGSAPTENSPCVTSSTGIRGWFKRMFKR